MENYDNCERVCTFDNVTIKLSSTIFFYGIFDNKIETWLFKTINTINKRPM